MKLIKLNCPSCRASLDILEDQKQTKCKYCHATIYLDDESIQVKHFVYSGDKEEKLKNAEALLKLKEYEKAFKYYEALSIEYVYETSVWYYMVVCLTENFTNFDLDPDNYPYPKVKTSKCIEYLDKYMKLETNEELKKEREKKYFDYVNKLNKISNDALKKEQIIYEKTAKKVVIVVLAVVTFMIISIIISAIIEYQKQKELSPGNITVESFFNNSSEHEYELQEVKADGSLCYHFVFHSDKLERKYRLRYKTYINGSYDGEDEFKEEFENDSTGWICWNLDKDKTLEVGKYEVYLYVDDIFNAIDTNSIKVVE